MKELSTTIIELIGHKTFAALSASERAEVCAQMSQEEYERLHEAVQQIGNDSEWPEPHPATFANLTLAFQRKHTAKRNFASYLLRPVQLWKVAAIFLFLGGGTVWIFLHARGQKEVSVVTIRDTVYVPSFSGHLRPNESDALNAGAVAGNTGSERHRLQYVNADSQEQEAVGMQAQLLPAQGKKSGEEKRRGLRQRFDTLLKPHHAVRM